MKSLLINILALSLLTLSSCGSEEKKEKGFQYDQPQKEAGTSTKSDSATDKPSERVNLEAKGIGPVDNLTLPNNFDPKMAEQGKLLFNTKCMACHQVEERMLGPKMSGILERRSPEWIMNIMLNPQEMLLKDPLAKELLAEFNNSVMIYQNLSEEDARAILEYLREL